MKLITKIQALVIALAMSASLAACSGISATPNNYVPEETGNLEPLTPLKELDLLTEPKNYQGPSTAMLSSVKVEQMVETVPAVLPVTVQSKDRSGDVAVTVTDTSRVLALSMSGDLAGLVYGLGLQDQLVGRDVSTNFPGTENLPVVTRAGHSLDAETVLSLQPTLIITDGSIGPIDVVVQLREAGIAVVFVDRDPSFTGTYTTAKQVGTALGVPESGEKLATILQNQVEEKIAEIENIAPSSTDEKVKMVFLYVRGGNGIYYIFGEESGATAVINAIGGNDAADQYGWVGMKPITDEAIIAMNPDLILLMSDGLKGVGGVDGLLEALPALSLTNAGKNKRFVDMADTVVLSFGPRSAEVLDALARAVYAPTN